MASEIFNAVLILSTNFNLYSVNYFTIENNVQSCHVLAFEQIFLLDITLQK